MVKGDEKFPFLTKVIGIRLHFIHEIVGVFL